MGSESTPRLPVINFKNLDNLANWEAVKSEVFKALVEYGCFEASFDKFNPDLGKELFGALKEFFDLPLETKLLNVADFHHIGYVEADPKIPLFENMGIDDANDQVEVERVTKILWPNGNPNFSKSIKSYCECVTELERITRKMVLESMGVEKYFDEHLNITSNVLRINKYRVPETCTDPNVGLPPHTDKGMLTIVYQDEVEGLEVHTEDGKWISYKPSPESFVIMVGDAFHAWSNGKLHPPLHRVLINGNVGRYSAGMFSTPRAGSIIKVPEELVDEEHPLQFKTFNYAEFLNFIFTQGMGSKNPLRSFCGV